MVAGPFALALKVSPLGNGPTSLNVAAGLPVVVTVKLKVLPTVAVALVPLVKFGSEFTVIVNFCVVEPTLFEAVMVIELLPTNAGVPVIVAVPFALALKVSPLGNGPTSLNVAAGL